MADNERAIQPSPGSNDVGGETNDMPPAGVSYGTDTRLHPAAKSTNKHMKNVNDDEEVVKNPAGEEKFLKADETDE